MARQESDREDLFAEAVTLTRRVECELSMTTGELVVMAGFRANGHFSLYLGPDTVYQFDADGRLRRADRSGFLFRTQGTTLARLRRERSATETLLLRTDLTDEELQHFQRTMLQELEAVAGKLSAVSSDELRRFPEEDAAVQQDVVRQLASAGRQSPWLSPPIAAR